MSRVFGWYYPSEVCGFDYKTTIVFNNSEYRGSNYKDMLVSHKDEKHIDAPTIPQVLKWLRENIDLYAYESSNTHYPEIKLTECFEEAFRQAMKGE